VSCDPTPESLVQVVLYASSPEPLQLMAFGSEPFAQRSTTTQPAAIAPVGTSTRLRCRSTFELGPQAMSTLAQGGAVERRGLESERQPGEWSS
jgi:hypothetical protein